MEFGKKHVLIWGSVFLLLVALVLAIRQLYIMFAVLALLAPVSFFLARGTLNALTVRREAPGLMKQGEQRPVRLIITNEGVQRRYFFTVGDLVPDGLEVVDEGGGRVLVTSLGADEQFTMEYVLHARRRGVYQIGPAVVEHADLVGLFNFRRYLGAADEIVVHPTPERIPDVWTRVAALRAPQMPRRRFRGEGTELYGTRPFTPGDDLRRIDWKSTARRSQLIVREYERAEATDATIILDLQRRVHHGEGDDATVERAVKLAASIADQMLQRGSAVGLVAAGAQDLSVAPSADPRQSVRLLDALARVQPDGMEELAAVVAAHRAWIPAGGMAMVISPRLTEDALAVAMELSERGHQVGWMVIEYVESVGGRRDEMDPQQLAARLADRGIAAWLVAAGRELGAGIRRARRAS